MCTNNKLCDKSECIVDFCVRVGAHYPVQYWADYCPVNKMVYFGGWWWAAPNLKCEKSPKEEDLYQYAWPYAFEDSAEVAYTILETQANYDSEDHIKYTIKSRAWPKYYNKKILYKVKSMKYSWV